MLTPCDSSAVRTYMQLPRSRWKTGQVFLMYIVHIYACCCVGLLALAVFSRRPWINSAITSGILRLNSFLPSSLLTSRPFAAMLEDNPNFGLYLEFRLPFLGFLLISHFLVLALGSEARTLIARLSMLLLVDLDGILLLAHRHSPFFDLAAAYQPAFLWAHSLLGVCVFLESLLLFSLYLFYKDSAGN